MSLALFWQGLPPWARTALMWGGAFVMLFLTGKFIIARHDAKVREDVLDEVKAKQAEVKIAVQERSTQIITEERSHADEAIRARDTSPDFPSSDIVPDPIARVIFRD